MAQERDLAAGSGRQETQGRRAWIRVDKAAASPATTRGVYDVAITGVNLHMAVVPPRIMVGGVPLQQLSFEPGGRRITGVLRGAPEGGSVSVDYGFASAGTTLHWMEHGGPAPTG
ncbi:hypothetical protein [Arthrobacter sp. 35W]|uniref:hypothetical protein n=1 Tax=Arthrobacter sp. 35W TaxID=1132441 RepID=UPI00047BF07E|nr:hypothetical protein [Arthrobacter sp. 35W]